MVEFLKGFLIYVIIWWIVVFTILPIGVRKPDKVEKGHAEGAVSYTHLRAHET